MLLVDVEVGRGHATEGCYEAARRRARLLSSYDNNSNNPQGGTDLLRGAW
jgi:hypothetical protein